MRSLSLALLFTLLTANFVNAQSGPYEVLQKDVGTWKATMKMWEGGPESQPAEFKGEETNRMLGEYWLISTFKCDLGGMPFEGTSTMGYDPSKKQYISSWVDSMTPTATHMTGSFDADTNTMTSTGKGCDMSGNESKTKSVVVYKGDDQRIFTMYMLDGDKEVKQMEITYDRVK